MRVSLARHDLVLRRAIEEAGGVVFKTMGDQFCAAFAAATDALTAALAAQRGLLECDVRSAECEIEEEAPPSPTSNFALRTSSFLKVRIALHTGVAEHRDQDYFGPVLSRVARLLDAAHGGQVLLSRATEELIRGHLPEGISLRDLGEHRLRDLTRPERIFQLVAPDLPAEFPPLGTLDVRRNNLPAQPTPLLGREADLQAACELLERGEVRLVTLTGPGGTGKTRLGLQVAASLIDRFPNGTFFVDLSPISDPNLVVTTIAQTLGVRETGDGSLSENLKAHLHDREMLLLLDNFEQVIAAAAWVAEMLAAAPRLKILVTSREPLRLRGEHEFSVPPLALPAPTSDDHPSTALTQCPSVRLFAERAAAIQPGFRVTGQNAPAIAEICRRLDGLPLAIELAAARVKLLSPEALLTRLGNRLSLLTGGARDLPARQRTLRGTIAWSHDLLGPEEQFLFRRLSVFVGGCSLEAAEAVCGEAVLDLLSSLVDKNLLRCEAATDGESRFTMLETVREFGRECLDASGELEAIRRRHATYLVTFAETVEPNVAGVEQKSRVDRLKREQDNMRAVLGWAVERGEVEIGLRLAGALGPSWPKFGSASEGRQRLTALLALPGGEPRTGARAAALYAAGVLAWVQGEYSAAGSFLAESAAIFRDLGETRRLADVLMLRGLVATPQGEYATAQSLFAETTAIARSTGDPGLIAWSLVPHARVPLEQGDLDAAHRLSEEALALSRAVGNEHSIALSLRGLGEVARRRSDYARARALFDESLSLLQELADKHCIPLLLYELARLAEDRADRQTATTLYRQCLIGHQEQGNRLGIAGCLEGLGRIADARGLAERAARLLGAAAALRDRMGAPVPPIDCDEHERNVADVRSALGDPAFTAAWTAGQRMTLEEAILRAIEDAE